MNTKPLTLALQKKLKTEITHVDYQTKQLHGGTLGDVQLITGSAKTPNGENLPFKIVSKTQKKWERFSDPNSWRREYDLYSSQFGGLFSESFRWPECYHTEINQNEDEIQIWMEYIDGISGLDLTCDMYAHAAYELGKFQGKLYANPPAILQSLTNLSNVEYAKKFYLHYRSWREVYDYIRAGDCELPQHLCKMLIDIDENETEIWARIEKLPIVLCHRDFWVTNIFYADNKIVLIDWDTTGWGYMGEDIASLLADEADVANMPGNYRRCVRAYYKGFSEYVDISHITDHCIRELILVMFGYRLVEWYKFAESPEDKQLHLDTLQKIFELRDGGRSFCHEC